MQQIDKHISELLYDYNCVIIPNFGGFLANYSSAKIHAVIHQFTPPSKAIVFNKNLKNNDGLLANKIATSENIHYSVAIERINVFVNEIDTRLKKGEKVNIDSIGILSVDVERNIQFKPLGTNFLTDAFGLAEFQSPALKKDAVSKKIEAGLKKELTKVIDINAFEVSPKRRVNYKRVVAVAAAVPLIFGIVWVSLKTDILQTVNYSNINPFASKKIVTDTVVIYTNGKSKTQVDSEIQALTGVSSIVKPLINVVMEEETTGKADTASVAKADEIPVNNMYHIVTGCFQMEENAKKFVNTLQQKNMEGKIIGKNDKGLFVVSSGNYASKSEAVKELRQLQKTQPEAWLFQSN
jgi:hypothetical protein